MTETSRDLDPENREIDSAVRSGAASSLGGEERVGIIHGVGAYVLWGLLPIYWKFLDVVPAVEILAHRVVWSMIFLLVVIAFRKRDEWWRALRSPKLLATFFTSSILLALNWGIYIWAVIHDQIVETSLGYFIAPLVMASFGVIFLGERLDRARGWALLLAGVGVCWLTFLYGSFPWVALSLAGTWSFYGLIRKIAPLGSLHGLLLETVLLTPVAALYLWSLDAEGKAAFIHAGAEISLFLAGAGIATSIPLLLFASAARRTSFINVGLLQYIAPVLQLLVGILLYGEEASGTRMVGFGFVWVALIIFIAGLRRRRAVTQ